MWFSVFFAHFYQPPRFNPWIEFVDFDSSAVPFHDWNERVYAECYSRLSRAPLFDGDWVRGVVNVYGRISFSFGPLLLGWLRDRHPRVYNAIVEADRESLSREGYGNAVAQPYAHIVMPLAERRYRELSISWGIKFFEKTFDRYPEGFWLPEAAVDYETLEILADYGIKFVVLGPHQIRAVKIGDRWLEVSSADPRVPYRIPLPSGRSITAVVYNDILSRELAFGPLADNGELLAGRIVESFNELIQEPQITSIAVDGETFGHHRGRGVRELVRALEILESNGMVRVTNYAKFISMAPPRIKARIAERTSWSCPHGVERWRSNCGCASDIRPGWSQEWRTPLRKAVDWMALEILKIFDSISGSIFKDPWRAALDYIEVLHRRDPGKLVGFAEDHLAVLDKPEVLPRALKLLEALRHTLLAQSSDAWFFEDLYRPEPLQILRHAGRAWELLEELGFREGLGEFKGMLREALSNRGIRGDELLEEALKSRVDPLKITAVYAMTSGIGMLGDEGSVYSFRVSRSRRDTLLMEVIQVDMGIVSVLSEVTMEHYTTYYTLVNLGGLNLAVGVNYLEKPEDYTGALEVLKEKSGLIPALAIVDLVGGLFKGNVYTIAGIPVDDRMSLARQFLKEVRASLREYLRQKHAPLTLLLNLLRGYSGSPPDYIVYALSAHASIEFEESLEKLDIKSLEELIDTMKKLGIPLNSYNKELFIGKLLELVEDLLVNPGDVGKLEHLLELSKLVEKLGIPEDLLEGIRVGVAELRDRSYPGMLEAARLGDETAWRWVKLFTLLARNLKVRV